VDSPTDPVAAADPAAASQPGSGAHPGQLAPPGPVADPSTSAGGRASPKGPARKSGARRRAGGRKSSGKRKVATRTAGHRASGAGRTRVVRSYPASSFPDAMELAVAIHRLAGDRIRRMTLFDELKKSPESGSSRQLITNSSRYGLTEGSYKAEYLALTEKGRLAVSPDMDARTQLRARFELAIEGVPPFRLIYQAYRDKKLPNQAVMKDFLREQGLQDEEIQACVDTFIVNAKFLGLLRPIAGAERVLPLEHVLEELPMGPAANSGGPALNLVGAPALAVVGSTAGRAPTSVVAEPWTKVCFYVTPIGSIEDEQRKHSDLFLSSIIEPALTGMGLTVVRADQIGKPGMITAQVIEHIVRSRLVIADLSFHNPNVFYEVALRHACRRPIVQVIRFADRIPFDLDQFRTIQIDTTDIYSLVPQLETYRSEIATQVRRALEESDVENPLTAFFPEFWQNMG
jgi:hypothetical protein